MVRPPALLATALAAAALALTAPLALTTTAQAAEVIECRQVVTELPNVSGTGCNTDHWGPISDFTIKDSSSGAAYQCQNGWAEGGLWVRGQDCRQAQD